MTSRGIQGSLITVQRWAALIALSTAATACGGSQSNVAAAESSDVETAPAEVEPEAPEEVWGGEEVPAASTPAPSNDAAPAASPSTPSAAPAASGDVETRTTQVIQEFVAEHRAKVRACYDHALRKDPSLTGDFVVRFTLSPEGAVKSIEENAEKSTLKSPDVAKCALSEIQSWKFPPSSRGMETTVNYPFNFTPKR
jgi:hypothetical protein